MWSWSGEFGDKKWFGRRCGAGHGEFAKTKWFCARRGGGSGEFASFGWRFARSAAATQRRLPHILAISAIGRVGQIRVAVHLRPGQGAVLRPHQSWHDDAFSVRKAVSMACWESASTRVADGLGEEPRFGTSVSPARSENRLRRCGLNRAVGGRKEVVVSPELMDSGRVSGEERGTVYTGKTPATGI
jgi:hypothetical protein